jgi:hypothetical protein
MRHRERAPVDYDVFICHRDGPDAELAGTLAAGLRGRGFRVFAEDRQPGGGVDTGRLAIIEGAPDFVLLLGADTIGTAVGADPVHAEVAHALAHVRNVVVVSSLGSGPRSHLPADLAGLTAAHSVAYTPDRPRESIAQVAHCLSSDIEERVVLRRFKRLAQVAVVILLAGMATQAVPALIKAWRRPTPLPPLAPFALYWTGFGQRLDGAAWREVDISNGAPVQPGDQIRLAFSTSTDGFAYVVTRSARGDVAVLFPTDVIKGASRVHGGQVSVAPVATAWWTIDERTAPGTLMVIASYDPIQNLEELVEEGEFDTTPGARRALVDQTLLGLLDGRHYPVPRRLTIRTGQIINQSLPIPAGPPAASATLASGTVVRHAMMIQRGLASAAVELQLRIDR